MHEFAAEVYLFPIYALPQPLQLWRMRGRLELAVPPYIWSLTTYWPALHRPSDWLHGGRLVDGWWWCENCIAFYFIRRARFTNLGTTSSLVAEEILMLPRWLLTVSTNMVGVMWLEGVSISSRAKFWAVAVTKPLDHFSWSSEEPLHVCGVCVCGCVVCGGRCECVRVRRRLNKEGSSGTYER